MISSHIHMMTDLTAAKDTLTSWWQWNMASVLSRHSYLQAFCKMLWLLVPLLLWWRKKVEWSSLLTNSLAICPFLDIFMLLVFAELDSELLLGEWGWKTLMSKYASWAGDQNPLARISRRASSMVMAVRWVINWQLRGWSWGSMAICSDKYQRVVKLLY